MVAELIVKTLCASSRIHAAPNATLVGAKTTSISPTNFINFSLYGEQSFAVSNNYNASIILVSSNQSDSRKDLQTVYSVSKFAAC